MLRAGIVPLEPYVAAMKPWKGLCVTCGKNVAPTLHNVKSGRGGCRYCAQQRDKFPTVEREHELIRLMVAAGFRPLAAYPGSHKPWRSLCLQCGREVTPHWVTVRRGGGCRHCTLLGG